MQITAEVPADRDALVRATRHMMKRAFVRIRILGLALIALAALELVIDERASFPALWLLTLGVLFIVALPWMFVRRSVQASWPLLSRPSTVRCDDWGVEWTSDLYSSKLAWQLVERVDETPGMLVMRTIGNRFLIVPTVGLSREEIGEIAAAVTRARQGQERMAG